jgi:hypothetical protein
MYFSDGRVDLAHSRLADRMAEADRARERGLARRNRPCPDQTSRGWRRTLRLPAAWRRAPAARGQVVLARREPLASAWDC